MSNNNSNLKTNTTSLQELLTVVNNLPEASNGVELPTLTNEGTAADLLSGKELIDGDGNVVTGTFTIDEELTTQETLLSDQDAKLAELAEILRNKASVSPVLQSKTITPTASEQTVTADSGYDGLRAVTVNGDENLIPENIVSGKSIFGVEGNAELGGGGKSMVSVTISDEGTMSGTYYFDENNMIQQVLPGTTITVNVLSGIVLVRGAMETISAIGNYVLSNHGIKAAIFLEDGGTAITAVDGG